MVAWIAAAAALLVIIGARLWTNRQMLTMGMVEKRVSSIYLIGFFGFIAASVALFVTVAWWAFVLACLAYFLSHKLIPSVLPEIAREIARDPYAAGTAAVEQAVEELADMPAGPEKTARVKERVDEIMRERGFAKNV